MSRKTGPTPGQKITFLVILLATVLLGACQTYTPCRDPLGCIAVGPDAPLRIGFERATIGESGNISASNLVDLNSFLDERARNKNAPLVDLITFDTSCIRASRNQDAAQIAGTANLAALIGPGCLDNNTDFLKLISDSGLTLLSTSTFLANGLPGAFSLFPSSSGEGQALADFLYGQMGLKSFTLIYESQDFFQQVAASFCQAVSHAQGSCLSQIPRTDISDPQAFQGLAENRSPGAVLVLVPFSTLDSFPSLPVDFPMPLFYFDPYLTPFMPASPRTANEFVIVASLEENGTEAETATFSSNLVRRAINTLLEVFPKISASAQSGGLMIGRSALRQALDNLWQPQPGLSALPSRIGPFLLTGSRFRTISLASGQ